MFFSEDGKSAKAAARALTPTTGPSTKLSIGIRPLHYHAISSSPVPPRAAMPSSALSPPSQMPTKGRGRAQPFRRLWQSSAVSRPCFCHAQILSEAVHATPVNAAVAGHHAVPVEGEGACCGPWWWVTKASSSMKAFHQGAYHRSRAVPRPVARMASSLRAPPPFSMVPRRSRSPRSRAPLTPPWRWLAQAVLDVLAGQRRGGFSPHRSHGGAPRGQVS